MVVQRVCTFCELVVHSDSSVSSVPADVRTLQQTRSALSGVHQKDPRGRVVAVGVVLPDPSEVLQLLEVRRMDIINKRTRNPRRTRNVRDVDSHGKVN